MYSLKGWKFHHSEFYMYHVFTISNKTKKSLYNNWRAGKPMYIQQQLQTASGTKIFLHQKTTLHKATAFIKYICE